MANQRVGSFIDLWQDENEPEEGGFTLLEEEVTVIRTPYGLTEIKACENNAFHF